MRSRPVIAVALVSATSPPPCPTTASPVASPSGWSSARKGSQSATSNRTAVSPMTHEIERRSKIRIPIASPSPIVRPRACWCSGSRR